MWSPIETAPETRVFFVVRAFNANIGRGRLYTTDPYCVWREGDEFIGWPHSFPPTHWHMLPEPPK